MEMIDGYGSSYADTVYMDQYLFYVDSEEDNLTKLEDKHGDDLKICRICLLSDCKLFSMDKYGLCSAYEQLTGVKICDDDGLPRGLCVECVTQLEKHQQFKVKSQVSEALFLHFLETDGTLVNIKEVDRYSHGLTSNLTENYIGPDSYTYTIRDITITDIQNTQISDNEYSEIEFLDSASSDSESKSIKNTFSLEIIDDQTAEIVMNSYDENGKYSDEEAEVDWEIDEGLMDHFEVTKLTVEEQMKELKRRRENQSYLSSKFKCETCSKGFDSESAYKSHVFRHEVDFGKYMCPICKVRYTSSRQKDAHYRKVHMYAYTCKNCAFQCQNCSQARMHIKWHQRTSYSCQICKMKFDEVSVYIRHMRAQHGTEHVCVMCGLSYGTELGLGTHLQDDHDGDLHVPPEGPWCESCNIQFSADDALYVHRKISPKHAQLRHESQDSYLSRKLRCVGGRIIDEYPKWVKKKDLTKFDKLPKLKRLRKTHYFDEPVPCEQCGKNIYSSREYRSHFVREHPNMTRTFYPYLGKGGIMCDKCGKVFSCQAVLREHMLTHGEHSMYACSTCEKRFKTRTQLKNHVRVHDAPSHECPLCGLMFNHRGNRDRHYTHAHSDVKNYKCDSCDKRFKTNDEKKLHTKHIHLKEPWPKRNRIRGQEPRLMLTKLESNNKIEDQYYFLNSDNNVDDN